MEHCLIIFEEKQKNYGFCEKFTKRREKYVYKNKLYDSKMTHESKCQEIKDRKHDALELKQQLKQ